MPESTDFRAWLDQTEREAHAAIARSYAEGRAALVSQLAERDSLRAESSSPVAASSKDEPADGDSDRAQQAESVASSGGDQHS